MKRTLGYSTTRGGWIGLAASVLALGIAFSSCRRAEEPSELVPNGEDLVAFDSQIGGVNEVSRSNAVSKAVDPLCSKTAFVEDDQMGFFLSLSSNSLLIKGNTYAKFSYDNLRYTYKGGKFTTGAGSPAGMIYYPYRMAKVDLWGIYPYNTDAITNNYSADAYPWAVAADQTTNTAVVASDFLLAVNRGVVPNNKGTGVDLDFKHRMTLLRLSIAFPEEVDGKQLDPTNPIAEIYLDNLKVNAAVNLNKETVAPATGAVAKTITPLNLGYKPVPDQPDNTKIESLVYQAIVVPQTVAVGTKLVRIVANLANNGGQRLFIMTAEGEGGLELKSGTMQTLSLSFDTQMRLRLEGSHIVAWDKNTNYNHAENVWLGENKTITVGNTVWAKGYLVANSAGTGCVVGGPLDQGLFFQFGSLVGWGKDKAVKVKPSTVTAPAWNSNYYNVDTAGELFDVITTDNPSGDGTGDACRFYLGSAWRLPTSVELFALTDQTANKDYNYSEGTGKFDKTTFSGKSGAWWGPTYTTPDTLTTPYMHHGGSFTTAQAHSAATTMVGSATLGGSTTTARTLWFNVTQFTPATDDRQQGKLIRCVNIRKIYEFTNPAMSGTAAATSLRFGFNFDCAWEITGKPAWLTLSATKGTATTGAATIALTMTPTDLEHTETARTADLTITATDAATATVITREITVKQNPKPKPVVTP